MYYSYWNDVDSRFYISFKSQHKGDVILIILKIEILFYVLEIKFTNILYMLYIIYTLRQFINVLWLTSNIPKYQHWKSHHSKYHFDIKIITICFRRQWNTLRLHMEYIRCNKFSILSISIHSTSVTGYFICSSFFFLQSKSPFICKIWTKQ